MKLTDAEKAVLDGREGRAKAKAMELLVRYGEALGAERLVETRNVAGTWATSRFMTDFVARGMDAVYSEFNLDSEEVVETPHAVVSSCQLIAGVDHRNWRIQGVPEEAAQAQARAEAFFGARGIQQFATCTPYQVGNVPVRGEHCAWMESSAVVYCNAVLGARTNTEGRESTGAASITGAHPLLGLPHAGAPLRHPRVRGGVPRRRHDGLGPARLSRRRGGGGGHPRSLRHPARAEPRQAQALRRGGGLLGRRGDVPHPRHHAGGADTRGGPRRQGSARSLQVRGGGAAPRLREPQRIGARPRRGLHHAGLPAQLHRAGVADREPARRAKGERQHAAVGAHAERHPPGRRPLGLHQGRSRTPAASS